MLQTRCPPSWATQTAREKRCQRQSTSYSLITICHYCSRSPLCRSLSTPSSKTCSKPTKYTIRRMVNNGLMKKIPPISKLVEQEPANTSSFSSVSTLVSATLTSIRFSSTSWRRWSSRTRRCAQVSWTRFSSRVPSRKWDWLTTTTWNHTRGR